MAKSLRHWRSLMRLIFMILAHLGMVAVANAQQIIVHADGNAMAQWCDTPEGRVIAAWYVVGNLNQRAMLADGEPDVCIQQSMTVRQLGDVMCKWLQDNPEQRHLGGPHLVTLGFKEIFPCTR
jgi:hypothetical protein